MNSEASSWLAVGVTSSSCSPAACSERTRCSPRTRLGPSGWPCATYPPAVMQRGMSHATARSAAAAAPCENPTTASKGPFCCLICSSSLRDSSQPSHFSASAAAAALSEGVLTHHARAATPAAAAAAASSASSSATHSSFASWGPVGYVKTACGQRASTCFSSPASLRFSSPPFCV